MSERSSGSPAGIGLEGEQGWHNQARRAVDTGRRSLAEVPADLS
jgi:hypothetical protein